MQDAEFRFAEAVRRQESEPMWRRISSRRLAGPPSVHARQWMYTAAAKSEKLVIKLTAAAPRKMKRRVERGLMCDCVAVVMDEERGGS
jgi:hypothetical protein